MQAGQIAEGFPVARAGEPALDVVRFVADRDLPGIVVEDVDSPHVDGPRRVAVSSTDLLHLFVPRPVRVQLSLARLYDEEHADRLADGLVGRSVGEMLPEAPVEIPAARRTATVCELAALMAQFRTPLITVQDADHEPGVVTAARLLKLLLHAR